MMSVVFLLFMVVLACLLVFTVSKFTEAERVAYWHEHHTWPPAWQPETEGYRRLMEEREREIMSLTGADERWENWMQYVSARLLPNFTEKGYAVIKTPPAVHEKLRKAVMAGVADWDRLPHEQGVRESIYADEPPKFVNLGSLAWEVLEEMRELHEQWIGGEIPLRPTSAYGVRLYQNGSTIVMHNDKTFTHVVSSIVHIAHQYDDDSNPWPLYIENHNGELVSVSLQEGEMMFYESAKCLHGRMRQLRGKYYGSVFLHYQPVDRAVWS
ncbi:hypothetical protein EON65_37495, partial [archaeon]